MNQAEAPVQTHSSADDAPRLWGLSSFQLHDAFWAARGVQCVRRGQRTRLQRSAELFLLIEDEELVLFDLRRLCDRLTWHNALVTRLRLIDTHDDVYSERVILHADGRVERIERRYEPQVRGVFRVVLTPSRRAASMWMQASSRRAAWIRVRRSVPWSRVDHWRAHGRVYVRPGAVSQREFISELVARWPSPQQAIDGIVESEEGVWRPASLAPPVDQVRMGPTWIGWDESTGDEPCLVGPMWIEDDYVRAVVAVDEVRIRPIREVELAEPSRPVSAARSASIYATVKRVCEVVLSNIMLLTFLPIMMGIAVMILLEDGWPIFFGHKRQTLGGKTFYCWKFRTMHVDADRIARSLDEYNVCDGPQVYIQDDPRVTRIGRMLRRTHLDELPQLWNVLRGHMSLVGPRPSPDDENQYCPAWRDLRLSVRPGITGLWQLKRQRKPGEDFQEWIKYDIEYVRSAGFRLDVSILIRTAWIMLFGRPSHADE